MDKKIGNEQRFFYTIGLFLSLALLIGGLKIRPEESFQMGSLTTTQALEASWAEEKEIRLAGVVGKISLNQAEQEALEALPGIGEKLAKAIIAYRQQQGAFETLEELMEVKGIGKKKFEQIKEYITLSF